MKKKEREKAEARRRQFAETMKRMRNTYFNGQRYVGRGDIRVVKTNVSSVGSAAELFGLSGQSCYYQVISREQAVAVLTIAMHQDLAYPVQLMPRPKALQLAERFVDYFGSAATFYSNGDLGQSEVKHPCLDSYSYGWTPVTDATFTTGILVVADGIVGCAWFEGED